MHHALRLGAWRRRVPFSWKSCPRGACPEPKLALNPERFSAERVVEGWCDRAPRTHTGRG